MSVTQRSKRKETFLPCHIQCMNNLISTLKSPLFPIEKELYSLFRYYKYICLTQ